LTDVPKPAAAVRPSTHSTPVAVGFDAASDRTTARSARQSGLALQFLMFMVLAALAAFVTWAVLDERRQPR
jgi:hypothetical protein